MSQMSLQELASALKPIMPIIKKLATIDDIVASLQSVEQFKTEATRAADKERKGAADAVAEAMRAVEAAKVEADKAKAQAASAAGQVAEANAKAKAVVDDASKRASDLIADAKAVAAASVDKANAVVAGIKADEISAIAARDAARKELAQAVADLEKARADLAAFKRSVGAVA